MKLNQNITISYNPSHTNNGLTSNTTPANIVITGFGGHSRKIDIQQGKITGPNGQSNPEPEGWKRDTGFVYWRHEVKMGF